MIRIGVMSDSHGASDKVRRAFDRMTDCSVIVHLGDHAQDVERLKNTHGKQIYSVAGNCDWFSNEENMRLMEMEGVRIMLTHGHREGVKNGLLHLSLKAEELKVQLACYGHTHIPKVDNDGECIFVNPGALRDGRYAIIELEDGKIRPFLKNLDVSV